MPIALSDEHEEQRWSARRWLGAHCPPEVPRALLDADGEDLQPVWKEMAAQGWLGIHLPEEFGGQGFGLFELAVILEETGWSVVPGPLLPTVVTSAVVAESASGAAARALLPGLIDGSAPGGGVPGRPVSGGGGGRARRGSRRQRIAPPVLGAGDGIGGPGPGRSDGDVEWCLIDVPGSEGGVHVEALASVGPDPPGGPRRRGGRHRGR